MKSLMSLRKFGTLVVELKWDKTVESAFDQVKKKNDVSALDEYEGNLLIVSVNTCHIESFVK